MGSLYKKYLIYASILLAILVIAYRLALFNDVDAGGNGHSALVSVLFFLAWVIPLVIGYKISKNKVLKYSIILGVVYLVTDMLVLDWHISTMLSSRTSIEQTVTQQLLAAGDISYFPSIANILFIIIVFIVLAYVGSWISKNKNVGS